MSLKDWNARQAAEMARYWRHLARNGKAMSMNAAAMEWCRRFAAMFRAKYGKAVA